MACDISQAKYLQRRLVDRRVIQHIDTVVGRTRADDRAHTLCERNVVERVVEKHDQIPRRVVPEPGIGTDDAKVATSLHDAASAREVLFGDLMQPGGDLDADDLSKRIRAGQQERPSHPGTDIDKGRGADCRFRNGIEQRSKICNGNGFIVGRMRVRVADRFGVEIVQEQNRLRRYAVVAIESSPAGAFPIAHSPGIRRWGCEHRGT